MITQFNGEELSALEGLPLASRVLYLMAIRPYMDYSTGMVGIKRGISLRSLSETLYVEPHQGMKESAFSRDQVYRLVGWLEKSGIVERRSVEREKLVFFLPLADKENKADYQERKKAATKPRQSRNSKAATGKPSNYEVFSDKPATKPQQAEEQKAATHPLSDNRNDKDKSLSITVDAFEKAWGGYPSREGSNPKSDALSQWKKRISEGHTVDEMIEGVIRYKAFSAYVGNEGTTFVMQAKRFFGPNKEFLNEWDIKQKSLGDRTSQNQGLSKTNGGHSTAGKVINGNFSEKDYGESVIRLPGFPG